MAASRPLQNPTRSNLLPGEGYRIEPKSLKTTFSPVPGQYALPLEKNFSQQTRERVADYWARIRKRELELQLMPIWRGAALSYAIVTSIATTVGLFFFGVLLFPRTAATFPLQYNPRSSGAQWREVDKAFLVLLPIIIGLIEYLALRVIKEIFDYDRRLSTVLSWILCFINILIVVAAVQVYALIIK